MASRSRRQLGAALLGGALCGVSLPPFEFLWGYGVLPGLFLVVWSWQDCRPRRALLLGWVAGLAFFGITLEWTRYFGIVAVGPLVAYMALGWAVVAALSARVQVSNAIRPWMIGIVWVCMEGIYARAPFGGLPWAPVALSMHDRWLRDSASFWGISGVSFILVVLSGSLAVTAASRGALRQRVVCVIQFDLAVLLAVGVSFMRPAPTPADTLRIAALQANVWNRDPSPDELASRRWLSDAHLSLASELQGSIDLIVFPESSLDGNDLERDRDLQRRVTAVGQAHGAYVIANGISFKDDPVADPSSIRYNTDYFFTPTGRLVGKYSKIHLVPFGEYLPLRNLLSWIPETERVGRFQPGAAVQKWSVHGVPIANIICFESVFGPFVRDAVRTTRAQIIVVATNNRSYERSGASEQHVALSQFRTVELNRPLVHAADSGITAFINAEGDVTDRLELFERGALVRTVQGTTGDTVYSTWGDWFTFLAWAFTGVLILRAGFDRVRVVRSPANDVPVNDGGGPE